MIIAFTGAGISKESGIPTFEEIDANIKDGELGIRDKLTRSWAIENPEGYKETIDNMVKSFENAEPNDAHKALAEYKIPIMTMNIDGLHQKAGSEHVINMHGQLPDIVLYEDPAPNYQLAMDWVERLRPGDIFFIIGTSFYTTISETLKIMAKSTGARVFVLNKDAGTYVRAFIENNKDKLGDFEEFINREIE